MYVQIVFNGCYYRHRNYLGMRSSLDMANLNNIEYVLKINGFVLR